MKGLTNKIFSTSNTVRKEFGIESAFKAIPPLICYNLYSLLILKPSFYFPIFMRIRSKKEVEARKILSFLGMRAPKLISIKEDGGRIAMEMELIKGESLYDFFKQREKDQVKRMAALKGRETRRLHEEGCAFLDNAPHNSVVKGAKLYYLDHEFFVEGAS